MKTITTSSILSYNRLLVILTLFSTLSLTFLYMYFNEHWSSNTELNFLKVSIMDRLCVGHNSKSILCRLEEVHHSHQSQQIIGNRNADESVSSYHHRDRKLDMDDKHRIMNMIVESELKKTLMKELAKYNTDDDITVETSTTTNELDTFYKNLTAAVSTTAAVKRKPDDGDKVKIKRSGFKISPEGGSYNNNNDDEAIISADESESESSAGFLTDEDFDLPSTTKKTEGDTSSSVGNIRDDGRINFSADRDSGFNIPLKTTHRSSDTSKIPTSFTPSPYTMVKQSQKCSIPVVDPFHREVLPYITYKWSGEKCTLRWKRSYVEEGGVLHVVGLTDVVQRVTVNYIKRIDDEENTLETHIVYDSKTMPLKGRFNYKVS